MIDLSVTLASLAEQKVWGVVVNYACDVLYDNLTLAEAIQVSKTERRQDTDVAVVLMLEPLTNLKEKPCEN